MSERERLHSEGAEPHAATAPVAAPLRCPVLIGRGLHLSALVGLGVQAAAGEGRVVLLAGEAGIGKSRLLAEATAHLAESLGAANEPGFLPLHGRCFEEDHALPFAALSDLFRRYLAARQPVLVSIDDVHWSDDATLDAVLYLARQSAALPLLLVLTYRPDEVTPALARVIAALQRERLATEMALRPLDRNDAAAMLRAIFALPQPVRPEFVEAVHHLAEGNSFFVEEIIAALVATGDIFYLNGRWDRKPLEELRLPRAVQSAVQRRLPALGEAARRLLEVAAVAGKRFDVIVLQEVTGQDERTLVAALKELVAAHLVVEESADVFVFRHALTQQAVYAGLLGRERRALHLALARALERRAAATTLPYADLAYHYAQAEDWESILLYAPEAGERAQALYAPQAAIAHFSQALQAARRLEMGAPPLLLRRRAQAYETVGRFDDALADYEMVWQSASRGGDAVATWQALIDLGTLWTARDYERAGAYFRQALELARGMIDPALLANSLNRIGNWYANHDQHAESRRHHLEALATFEALGDRHGIAETLDYLGTAYYQGGDPGRGTVYHARAAALFLELGDRQRYAYCLAHSCAGVPDYLASACPWGEAALPESLRRLDLAVQTAREIGWRSGEASCLGFQALIVGPRGEYTRALAAARTALEIATEIEHGQWAMGTLWALGAIYCDVLAFAEARKLFEEDDRWTAALGSVFSARFAAALHASACVGHGDLDVAQQVLDRVAGPDLPFVSIAQRLLWCAHAELALARGQAGESLRIVDRLIAEAADGATPATIPRLGVLRGASLERLGRHDEAAACLRATAEAARRHGARPTLWRALAHLARTYQALGRYTLAEEVCADARAIIDELASGLDDDRLRAVFLRQAAAELPRLAPLPPLRAAKRRYDGLTAREREVAALLTRGLSNRAIAAELVVSERTVERHVENSLAKLGFTSRSQIALWAVEKGLARPHAEPAPGHQARPPAY